MLIKFLFMTGLLIAGQAFAIDEDFYIPYTDNYGYVYDPETGQYVKQEPATSGESVVGNTVDASKGNSQDHDNQAVAETADPAEASMTIYLVIGGGIFVLVAFTYWSSQRKKDAVV